MSCTEITCCLAQIALAAVGSLALIGRAIVSGSAESSSELSKNAAKKKRKRANAKEKSEPVEEPAQTPVPAKVSSKPPQSNGKQQPHPAQPAPPPAVEEIKDDVPVKKRTAAERKAGKTRKTKVDDMLSEPQGSSYARVMKIADPDKETRQPAVMPQPEPEIQDEAPTFAEVVEKEPDWEEVPKKAKSISISGFELAWLLFVAHNLSQSTENATTSSYAASSPTAASQRSVPGLGSQSDKKSRQNAARSQAAKDIKQQAEVERQARLNEHRRARQAEEERARQKARQSKGVKSQNLSGGMKAAVSDTGALIWE